MYKYWWVVLLHWCLRRLSDQIAPTLMTGLLPDEVPEVKMNWEKSQSTCKSLNSNQIQTGPVCPRMDSFNWTATLRKMRLEVLLQIWLNFRGRYQTGIWSEEHQSNPEMLASELFPKLGTSCPWTNSFHLTQTSHKLLTYYPDMAPKC